MKYMDRVFRTDSDRTTVLICLIVGHVFITQGNQQDIFSEALGVGPFNRIGLSFHELIALATTKLLLKGAGEYSADKRSMQAIERIL